jgi:CMP/dCMP kinase
VLGGRPEVLRVFVTASPKTRAARLSRESGLDERAAAKSVEESDKERARYLERFYQVRHEMPVHYDLTLNTDLMTPATAAALIAQAARA